MVDDDPVLPPLYEAWIRALLGDAVPRESQATCADCAMIERPGVAYLPEEARFDPAVKCCTFYPNLPNFSVGRILLDWDAPGKTEVEARIRSGVRVSPFGIDRPPMYNVILRESSGDAFGRAGRLRCSFYTDDGRCGIWRYREGTCATWFCKHDRGAIGKRFWHELQKLLYVIERQLALWCVLELDVGDEALRLLLDRADDARLDPAALDGDEPASERRRRWGRWAGRERELYMECARLVEPLDWAEVERIGGAMLRAHARAVTGAFAALGDEAVPERLRAGAHRAGLAGPERVRLLGYSRNHAVEVSRRAAAAVPAFDGRPTAEVLAELGDDAPDPGELRLMRDVEVLIPVEDVVARSRR